MDSVRDYVRARLPLIESSAAYSRLVQSAERKRGFMDDGRQDDDDLRAADEVLERMRVVVEEAARRAAPHLQEAARRGAAALLLEKLPAASHHFSVLDVVKRAAMASVAVESVSTEPAQSVSIDSMADSPTSAPNAFPFGTILLSPSEIASIEAAMPRPESLAAAFDAALRLRDSTEAAGVLDADQFREAWLRYLCISVMSDFARTHDAKHARRFLPFKTSFSPPLSDLHALLLAWQTERKILNGAQFARFLATVAFVEAHEDRLTSEGLVRRIDSCLAGECSLFAALGTIPYSNRELGFIPGAGVFRMSEVIEFALEIDELLRNGGESTDRATINEA